jgi:iron complex outermembrane recepter protein
LLKVCATCELRCICATLSKLADFRRYDRAHRPPGAISLGVLKHMSATTESTAQRAARFALLSGTAAAAALPASQAIAQEESAEGLDEIVVTGTRIRRVDQETASPVQVVNAAAIAESGVQTLGDLLSRIPAIGGQATNPSTNNGGGDGASNVELRGLGVERTLVLVNGRRYGALGNLTSAVDVNSIPVNMIERVEVLKQGAGAIYGSDAIGGVVNFITKQHQDGAEISLDYGKSNMGDGARQGLSMSWGTTGDKGNVVLGFNYNQQDGISAGNRAFSRNAIYFYGSVFEGGSSRVPTGRAYVDSDAAGAAGLDALYGCPSVTRRAGAAGTSVGDFRCYVSSGANSDGYNFQPLNLIVTPQERASLFALSNYQVTDDIELYTEFVYNYTTSGYAIAPLPFDSRSDDVIISSANIYNPFDISFGGGDVDPLTGELNSNATFRMEALGNRRGKYDTYQGHFSTGLRGSVLDTGWNWDANVGYSRLDQFVKIDGYLYKTALQSALGPSFLGAGGVPTCGTPAAPISGCVPLNIFNLSDPSQITALQKVAAGYNQSYRYDMKQASLNANGSLFELPAGEVQAAVGVEYRDQLGRFDTDFITQSSPPLYKDCLIQNEACSGDQRGGYNVRELYAEVLVPILKDAPFAQSLNLSIGGRYSDYSTFGNTTNGTYQLEWRPVNDLLLRATYADIFRAPTIIDIYQAPSADAATFTDPCVGLTAAAVAANPNLAAACVNVPRDGSFEQANSQVDGLLMGSSFLVGGRPLQPETGDSITAGFVYDPSWAQGLSVSVDAWRYKIENVLTQIDVNTSAEQCAATGSPQFCGYINRFGDGSIRQILEPTVNLGQLEVDGVDFSANYKFDTAASGAWRFGVDASWTHKYDSTVIAGGNVTQVAGYYDRQYGNLASWRMNAQIGWQFGPFTALGVARFIDSLSVSDPDGAPGIQPDLLIGSVTYVDLTLGYTLPWTGSKVQLGVQNLTDKAPPILYQNNVTNANTDVATYDTIGRYFFAGFTHKF